MENKFPGGFYVGQRLSLKSQLCTVRFFGEVSGRPGNYLGVEWDDPTRGKHAGSHENVSYFKCRSQSSTVGSFIKPNQPWDRPRSFLEALRDRYMNVVDVSNGASVYFSGKEAEEIGFAKFGQRQRGLHGIHTLVLDGMRVHHGQSDVDLDQILEFCAEITELDLSNNLLESLEEIVDLVRRLPKLKTLTLDGNRFSCYPDGLKSLQNIKVLNLRKTLLDEHEISIVSHIFSAPETFSLSNNELHGSISLDLPTTVTTLDLTSNELSSISEIGLSKPLPNLRNLILKRNNISTVGRPKTFFATIQNLDVSYNAIDDWSFITNLSTTFPALAYLRVTGNPLYSSLKSAQGAPLAAEDGYMLTLARIRTLQTLNYSTITEKDRLNAEAYYLGQIGAELSLAPSDEDEKGILSRHPRYNELCDEYGAPTVQRKQRLAVGEPDPSSLAARLIDVEFTLRGITLPGTEDTRWIARVPRSFTIYMLIGLVAKRIDVISRGMTPLNLQLVLETSEEVPEDKENSYTGPEWWDSDDEAGEDLKPRVSLVKREIKLTPGTRALSTYVDGRSAKIRVELKE